LVAANRELANELAATVGLIEVDAGEIVISQGAEDDDVSVGRGRRSCAVVRCFPAPFTVLVRPLLQTCAAFGGKLAAIATLAIRPVDSPKLISRGFRPDDMNAIRSYTYHV